MKQMTLLRIFFLSMILMYPIPGMSVVETDSSIQKMTYTTEFSYYAGPGDSRETALALALYGGKQKAVLLSAKHLASQGLLNNFGDKLMAVFCLVADDLHSSLVYEYFSEKTDCYTIKITSEISLIDFVKVEIENAELEKNEMQFSLKEEMDPFVTATINPAQELSRVYRYLGKQEWRMAIIYLDRLENKYPYWGEIFWAKALGFQGMHETEWEEKALASACKYGNHEACAKLETLE